MVVTSLIKNIGQYQTTETLEIGTWCRSFMQLFAKPILLSLFHFRWTRISDIPSSVSH